MQASRHREPSPDGRVLVWDAAVRLFHWSLAALVVVNFVHDDGDLLHRQIGYAAVGVVLARLLWGSFTHGAGAFASLKPSVSAARQHLRDLMAGRVHRHLGHNPLGVWMVWLLWSLVLLLGVTGWMSRLDAFWGDERLHELHSWLADVLLVSVALHLAGVAAMSWIGRENLTAAMLSGMKRTDDRA